MTVIMTLGGVDLGDNFPHYSQTFEPVRVSDQGGSFRKVNISLAGFIQGRNSEEVLEIYEIIATVGALNDTLFTYKDGLHTVHDNKKVYVAGYAEPQDGEHAKYRVGDYSISLYYYEDSVDSIGIECTYGDYTFDKTPKWGRSFTRNRESHRSPEPAGEGLIQGSTSTVTLSGIIFRENHADLMAAIDELTEAFSEDRTLTYGVFSQSVHVSGVDIAEDVKSQFAFFSINLTYDIGEIVELRRKISFSRIHNNTVITEQPFCNSRLIQHMNVSGQFVTYRLSLTAENIVTARNLISVEAANLVEPGGIEMQGGEEGWDEDNARVDLTIIKFYNSAILPNIP